MAIGGEIKVVLTLDDNGFTLKTKQAKSTSDALDQGLQDLAKSAKGVETPLANAAKTMESIAGKLGEFASGFKAADASISPVQKSVAAVASSMSSLAGGLKEASDIAAKAGKNIASVGEAAAPVAKSVDQAAAAAGTLAQNFDKSIPALLRAREGLQQAGQAAATSAGQVNSANNSVAASSQRAAAALLTAPNAAMRAALANQQLAGASNKAAQGTTAAGNASAKANTSNTALANAITKLEAGISKLAGTVVQLVRANNNLAASTDKNTTATNSLTSATTANTTATNSQSSAIRAAGNGMGNVRGQADALTGSLRAMAGVWAGMKIEAGLKASVNDAAEMQRLQVAEGSFNFGAGQDKAFFDKAFDLSNTNKFLSQLDAVKARLAAIGSVGSNNQMIIDATLDTAVKAANNLATLGYAHGDTQNTIRNLYGVVETRQQVYDPQGAKRTMELMQKISTATGGKVTMQDAENVLRMMSSGAARLTDDGLINLMSIVDQSKTMGGGMGGSGAGVSRVGTSFKMFQQYAQGKQLTDQATQIFLDSGLLNTGAIDPNADPRLVKRQAKHAGLIDTDLAMGDPVGWLQKHYDQLLSFTQKKQNRAKYYEGADINDEHAQLLAFSKLLAALGIQTTAAGAMAQAADPHSAQRINEQRETVNNSKGVNQVNDELQKTYDGSLQQVKASLSDIAVLVGSSVLPALASVLQYVRDILIAFKQWGTDNPVGLQLTTIATAATGAVLALRGFLSLTGTVGGILKAVSASFGLVGTQAGAAAAATATAATTASAGMTAWLASIGAFVATAGRLFMRAIPYVGWLLVAWDLTQLIGGLEVGGHKVSDWFTHWFDSLVIKSTEFWKKLKGVFADIKSWKLFDDDKPADPNAPAPTKFVSRQATGAHGYENGGPNQRAAQQATVSAKAEADRIERERLFNGGYTVKGNADQVGPQRPAAPGKKHGGIDLEDANPAITNAITTGGHQKREFEDPFTKFMEQLKAKGDVLGSDLGALLSRQPKGMDALRADALTEFTAKWKGGDFDKAHDPRNRQWKNADGSLNTGNAQVKDAVEQLAKNKELEEQKKALVFVNERLASTENDLQAAQENASENGAAKQTREMRALERELARAEERLGKGTKGWEEWTKRKNEALANRAGADLLNFASSFKESDDKTMMGLLPYTSQRKTAEFDAKNSKDLDQYNLNSKALKTSSDAEIAAETDPDKRADLTKKATALQLQAEQEFNQHLAVVAAERARLLESPLDGLVRAWKDTFEQMQQAEASWANSVIDEIMQFVQTGKFHLGKLAESMALDVLKIKLQETFSTPLKLGLDALTGKINQLVFPNASSGAGSAAAGLGASAAAGAGASAQVAATDAATTSLKAFTQQGVQQATQATTQQITEMITAGNVQGAATTSMGALANAAMVAAQALASMSGSSTGSGLGGLFGSMGSAFGMGGSGSAAASGVGANTYGFTMPAAFANGGIMTNKGVAQLRKYANGGVADSPQLALYGEGSMAEAYVPLPDGRSIPVTISGNGGSGSGQSSTGAAPSVTVNVINQTNQSVGAQQGQPRFDGKQMILDVVLTNAQTPGSFRDGLRSAMK